MSDTLSRGLWPLARGTRIVLGDDGKVRSAEVETKAGALIIRPVTKLCSLEKVSNP